MTDSNGKGLDAQKLKPGAQVDKKERSRLKQAIDQTPKVSNPHEVNDVVFQIGLNDFQKGFNVEEIEGKYLEMQITYKKLFPNARQHVTALPPLTKAHITMNKSLEKLAQNLESNFISTKAFLDHTTGKLRGNLMRNDNYHYNDVGIRHLAKEIKKSLFSNSNRNSQILSQIIEMRHNSPAVASTSQQH